MRQVNILKPEDGGGGSSNATELEDINIGYRVNGRISNDMYIRTLFLRT